MTPEIALGVCHPVLITSPQNPKVKHAVKLRERRQRDREGLMLVEGREELSLALASGVRPTTLFYCPSFFGAGKPDALMARARESGAELIEASAGVFEKIAYRENPDGWLAVIPALRRRLDDLPLGANPLLVVAEAVEKPGNLGAILRTMDAAGADALIVCDPTTDLGNPNVVRASKGALFSVPAAEAEGAEALAWLKARGIRIIATTPQADTIYTEADLRGPAAIAVGAEDEGLSGAWLAQADLAVRLPMRGRVNSLNVAAAGALLLYEAVRQRQAGGRMKDEG
jgi:TrmH family RNA methyltransferase